MVAYGTEILLQSPALTGTPTAPTAAPGTNTTQLATTAFDTAAIAAQAALTLTNKTATPTAGVPLVNFATTVGAGSNGGEISLVASWATPSAGVLALAAGGATGWPASGSITVAASGSTTAVCTYTGIGSGGSSLTGVAYVSGSATGTVSTGGAVSLTPTLPNILSWTAPNDGNVHWVQLVAFTIASGSPAGGQIDIYWTDPASGNDSQTLFAASPTSGYHGNGNAAYSLGIPVKANTTYTVTQQTSLTAGTVTLYATILAA